MALYVSLKGEAEEELEHCELSRINCSAGVNNILLLLRSALKTRIIYQKRKYLFDFEHVARYNAESIQSFCNRYHRVERSLIACKVDIGAMYDSEARGARLLDRRRLSAEQQHLVLVRAGALHFCCRQSTSVCRPPSSTTSNLASSTRTTSAARSSDSRMVETADRTSAKARARASQARTVPAQVGPTRRT